MNSVEQLRLLYQKVYGERVTNFNLENIQLNDDAAFSNNDAGRCCLNCISKGCKQDIPFYQKINEIKAFMIGESPGNNSEINLGTVFGWKTNNDNNANITIKNYFHFFTSVLKIDLETTYITDAVKCYTPKNNFAAAFSFCQSYLREEIDILSPQIIIIISKQRALYQFLKANYNKIEILQIPHPSKQNISKIKTVAEIFKGVGEITNNQNWVNIGKLIETEYPSFKQNVK